jgi:hypothetical protein
MREVRQVVAVSRGTAVVLFEEYGLGQIVLLKQPSHRRESRNRVYESTARRANNALRMCFHPSLE